MKKSLVALCMVALMVMGAQSAQAVSFTFGDDDLNFWPGWNNGTADDNKDTIGRPQITGGTGIIDDAGYLTSLNFAYNGNFSGIGIGDVFIDIISAGGPQTWDFVLDTTTGNVYEVNIDLASTNPNDYIMSDVYYSSGYRELHPVEVNPAAFIGDAVGGFTVDGPAGGSLSFTNISGIEIGFEDFYLGFAPDCANDVVYEFIDPVPEPSTVLLLGLGLLGVLAVGRKRMKK